ncbi:heparinase II/III family protein [Advenella kashmirensis]
MTTNQNQLCDDRIQILFELTDEKLTIKIDDSLSAEAQEYACYLMFNQTTIDKRGYRKENEFHFRIKKPGLYRIKVFTLDHSTLKKTSQIIDLGFLFVLSQYYKSNRTRFINESFAQRGREFISESKIRLGDFLEYKFEDHDFWAADPFSNRTWRWHLHQLTLLSQLVSAHSADSNDVFLEEAYRLLGDWHEYASIAVSDKMLWHDQGSALRLKHICMFLIYALSVGFVVYKDAKFVFILNLIKIHLVKLKDDSFYSRFTNHGFDQSLVLFQVALELEYILDLKEEITLAAERIHDEVNFVFCSDGGHKENSPGYLSHGIKQCITALNIERSYNEGISLFKWLETVIAKATQALCHTMKPDGYLPLIGDTTYIKQKNIFHSYKPNNFPQFQYALTGGKSGISPGERFFVLPDTGYAFFRSHWNKANYTDAVHLSLKAGCLSRGHRQDDDLTFTLYGYGEDWLVDGGTYKYDDTDPHRKYIQSHLSHNLTAPLDHPIAKKMGSNPKFVKYTKMEESGDTIFYLHATTEMFRRHFYSRKIEFRVPSEKISIEDVISHSESAEVRYISRLFFAKEKEVQCGADFILVKGKQKSLMVRVTSNEKFSIKPVKVPQEKIIGWLSDTKFLLYQSNLVQILFDQTAKPLNVKFSLEFI